MLDQIATAHARRMRTECDAPAIAWAVVEAGRVTAAAEGGSVSTDTRFRIASMTKSFTAAVVLMLRDEGVIGLDVPVGEYAAELRSVAAPGAATPITLRHLLSMSAGMATDDPWADRHLDASREQMDQIYSSGVAFAHETGEAFEYSNLGFGMIGRVVETVTGVSVRDLIIERLLEPLGMKHTGWTAGPKGTSARGHVRRGGSVIPDPDPTLGYGEISPMGGLWSTAGDLAVWMQWLDRAFTDPESRAAPLRASSRREMQTIHTYAGTPGIDGVHAPSGYGYGLLMRDDPVCGMVAGHSGGLPGFGSNMRWIIGTGVGVVALANVTYAPMSTFTMRVLSESVTAGWVDRRRIPVDLVFEQAVTSLVALLVDWDDARARELFSDNVELDDPFEFRAAECARIMQACGGLMVESLRPLARTRGDVVLVGSLGRVTLTVLLSPVGGDRIQSYLFGAVQPLE